MQTFSDQMRSENPTMRNHKQTVTEVTMSLVPPQGLLAMLLAAPRTPERVMIARKRIGSEWRVVSVNIHVFGHRRFESYPACFDEFMALWSMASILPLL